jgi:tRNA pseudouridine synthase 10
MDLTDLTEKILSYGEICDHCLGRMVGKSSFGLTNDQRGIGLRTSYYLARNEPYQPHEGSCWICQDLFTLVDAWANRVVVALDGIEYRTFLIGTRVPPLIAENEEMVWSDLSLAYAEPIKSEINREVGKAVSEKTGRDADLASPDVLAILDIGASTVEVQIRPIFFYGRYRKLERGIPQTHWDCRSCRGRGCERCGYTGKQYADSVEELIARPAAELFAAEKGVLHGAGREDIDARMIGTGRPFIMEMVAPRHRSVDLQVLEGAVNRSSSGRVEVSLERWTRRGEVETIKSDKGYKKYRILVEIDNPLSLDELRSALQALCGVTIYQRTPQRVAHRRADIVRERKALEIGYAGREGEGYVIELTGEAGLYIKELVSGDCGRTRPSLSGILGIPARVTRLDVVQVSGTKVSGD